MACHDSPEIGHHLMRVVLSYVPGRRVDSLGSGFGQLRDSLATRVTRRAITKSGRRVGQCPRRRTAILINRLSGSLCDRQRRVLRRRGNVDDSALSRVRVVCRPGQW